MRIRNIAIPAVDKKQSYSNKIKKEIKQQRKELFKIRHKLDRMKYTYQKLKYLYRISENGPTKYNYYKTLRNAWVPKANGICEICRREEAYCKHHIIPISKGGSNSDLNLINICISCHAAIHPFMVNKKEFDYPDTTRQEAEMERMQLELLGIVKPLF